ncbi:MAG: PD-(D/E)XK nuclease family transposase [Thermoguttaceae bacterium]|nr:PD-(D/E)XK nuclease family transposase [Thermoguttaceae bacterium]
MYESSDDEGWIDLCHDTSFRPIFGSEGSEPIAMGLLNAILQEAGLPLVKKIFYLNPFQLKDKYDGRETVLDVLVEDENGDRYNIEMQTCSRKGWRKRTVYYCSRAFVDQFARRKGEEKKTGFETLRRVVCIALVRFPILASRPNQWFFHWKPTDSESGDVLEEWSVINVRVPRETETPIGIKTPALFNWLQALGKFGAMTKDERDALEPTTPGFRELRRKMLLFSGARKLEMQRARDDFDARLADQYEEGREEGLEEGLERGRRRLIRVARNALKSRFGVDPSETEPLLERKSLEELESLTDAVFELESYDDFLALL